MRHFLPLVILLCLTACENALEDLTRVDETRYRAEFAVPLVDSRVNLTDLVGEVDERVTLTVEADGLLRFTYLDTVPAVTSDVAFEELRDLTRGIPLAITQRRETLDFPLPAGARLQQVVLKGGQLTYNLPNTYDRPVNVTFTIPNARKDGKAFSVSGRLPAYAGSGDPPALNNADNPSDFTDYVLDFSEAALTLEYQIDELDGTALKPATSTVAAFTNLDFSFIEGFLGTRPYPGVSDRLAIGFFSNYLSGEVDFVEPRIVVSIRNGFGLPARAVVEQLNVTTVDGRTVEVTGEVVDDGFDFNYPTEPGSSATTTYVITEDNSNLRELLASKPVALNYRISALLNPDGEDSEVIGFLSDTSTYTATIDVELPLYGSAKDFRLRDSFAINLGERYAEVSEASFRITTDNGIPFDLSLTGTFVDSLGNALLDLTDGELLLIEASPVDDDGNATGVRTVTSDIPFTGERLTLLRRASSLVLSTTFATTENGNRPVRITDTQELRVRIGARLTAENE